MLELYKNIKRKRKEMQMSQTELAKRMGYADKSMISRIEKGEIDLQLSKIIAFSEIFNMHPGDLMGWDSKDITIPNYSPQINSIIAQAQQLNNEGLKKVNNYADDLVSSGKYEKPKIDERAV